MTFTQFIADSVGLSLVHWDASSGVACFWNGGSTFLEYEVTDERVRHGDAWSTPLKPGCVKDAEAVARTHYGTTRD